MNTVTTIQKLIIQAESPEERKILMKTLVSLIEQRDQRMFTEGVEDLITFTRDSGGDVPFFTEVGLYDLIGKDDARSVLARINKVKALAGVPEEYGGDTRAARAKAEDDLNRAAFWFAHNYYTAVNPDQKRIDREWSEYEARLGDWSRETPERMERAKAIWMLEHYPTLKQLQDGILEAYQATRDIRS